MCCLRLCGHSHSRQILENIIIDIIVKHVRQILQLFFCFSFFYLRCWRKNPLNKIGPATDEQPEQPSGTIEQSRPIPKNSNPLISEEISITVIWTDHDHSRSRSYIGQDSNSKIRDKNVIWTAHDHSRVHSYRIILKLEIKIFIFFLNINTVCIIDVWITINKNMYFYICRYLNITFFHLETVVLPLVLQW